MSQGESRAGRAVFSHHCIEFFGGFLSAFLLSVALLLASTTAYGSAGGRSGFSGNPGTNAGADCTVCHAPDGAGAPALGIAGPSVMEAGSTKGFLVFLVGGPAVTAGIGISASDAHGTLTPFDADLHVLDGELTMQKIASGNGTGTLKRSPRQGYKVRRFVRKHLDDIYKIEVLKGKQAFDSYGVQGMNGVIKIVLKEK